MTVSSIIGVLTTVCTGLIAGLFYSYACSVVLGLKSLTDREYIASMQSINRAILNPVFFICFFGALLLLPLHAYMNYSQGPGPRFWLLIAAAFFYLVGVFGVTVAGNIPLNNVLEKFDLLNASPEAVAMQRKRFERPWNNLNTIRTVSSILSLLFIAIASINGEKADIPLLKGL